jgi:hypothetical protein
VLSVLQSKCWSCHGDPPEGAPMALVTRAELLTPSTKDPTKTYAERALVRMLDTNKPMPPKGSPAASAADVAAIQKWVDGGRQGGTCSTGGSGAGGTGSGGAGAVDRGLPCDVATLLKTRCDSCHGTTPTQGAPMSLVTYDDLVAPSASNPAKTNAQVAVERMANAQSPMPPKKNGPATAAETAILQAWIDAKEPHGTCGSLGGGGTGGTTGGGGQTGAGGSSTAADDLPCEIKTILDKHCLSCHGNPQTGGATVPLTSWADLQAVSPSNPPNSVAQEALARIQGMGDIMPPAPSSPISAAEIAQMQSWVSGGAAKGTGCGAPVTCSSGKYWTPKCSTFNEDVCNGDSRMNPGNACISCHKAADEPDKQFWIAGTVYPTLHEENYCYGVDGSNGSLAGLQVIVTDANKKDWTLDVGSSGNFFLSHDVTGSFKGPYSARVVSKDGTMVNAMKDPQTSGDCNSCHTQAGVNMAPGRITSP